MKHRTIKHPELSRLPRNMHDPISWTYGIKIDSARRSKNSPVYSSRSARCPSRGARRLHSEPRTLNPRMPDESNYPKIAQLKTVAALRLRLSELGLSLPIDDKVLSA